ncbi:MAG: glycoside hydrolase family 16 protein [Pseudomonadota bacterium]
MSVLSLTLGAKRISLNMMRAASIALFSSSTTATLAQDSLALTGPAPDAAVSSEVLRQSGGATATYVLRPTFAEEFNNAPIDPLVWSHQMHRRFFDQAGVDINKVDTRVFGNQQALGMDPSFEGTTGAPLGLNPFLYHDSELRITATWLPEGVIPDMLGSNVVNGMSYDLMTGIVASWPGFEQQHGFFEIRAKLPQGQGVWPAFWLVSKAPWPAGGEIDVLEAVRNKIHHTIHWEGVDGTHLSVSGNTNVPGFTGRFHNFGVLWTPAHITFYVDRVATGSVANPGFETPMYLVANLGIGGDWPGPVNPDVLPVTMNIDWIRAYEITDRIVD